MDTGGDLLEHETCKTVALNCIDNQLDGCVTNSYFKLTTFRTAQVERDYFLVDRKITASLNINPILD